MSDDLVKRLRAMLEGDMRPSPLGKRAADRIEELEANLAKTMDALAGVDKFVRDLSPFADPSHSPAPALAKACVVYAELTGGNDE